MSKEKIVPLKEGRAPVAITPVQQDLQKGRAPVAVTPVSGTEDRGRQPVSITPVQPTQPPATQTTNSGTDSSSTGKK